MTCRLIRIPLKFDITVTLDPMMLGREDSRIPRIPERAVE
jgi:hypothetical protein